MEKQHVLIILAVFFSAFFYGKIYNTLNELENSLFEFQTPGEILVSVSKGTYNLYELIPENSNTGKTKNWSYQIENNVLTAKEIKISKSEKTTIIRSILQMTLNHKEYIKISQFDVVAQSGQIKIKSNVEDISIKTLAVQKDNGSAFELTFMYYIGLIVSLIALFLMIVVLLVKKIRKK